VWHQAKANAGRPDLRMAHNEFVHVAKTCETASREAEPAAMWYVRKAAELWGTRDAAAAPADYAYLAPILDKFATITWEQIYENLSIIGDPERAVEKIRQFDEAGVDELILFAGMGPQLTRDMLLRSLELFGERVIPHFKAKSANRRELETA
jgi:alkanesulfonate monooxygenase SsuD/methylene tetrahydromethanopterin reductase-like flavin-dependent oxidoreductase (luciferase family)